MLKTSTLIFLSLAAACSGPQPALANEPRHTEVVFSIAQDGSLRWVKVLRSSIQRDEDDSVDAIKQSAPFRPLPLEYGEHAEFKVNYEYWCTHRHDFSIQQVQQLNGAFVPIGDKLESCWSQEKPKARTSRFRAF